MSVRKKVIVGLSGGVDSSVATILLKEAGYDVTGVTMAIYSGNGKESSVAGGCYAPEEKDIEDVQKIAEALQIPFHVVDLKKEYKTHVLDYFQREYISGRTPNPCVQCNKHIKFGTLLEKVSSMGIEYDFFATGHYAGIEYSPEKKRYLLKKAKDLNKDQTYFICRLSQEQLKKTLFPLSDYLKSEVREIAAKHGLFTSEKPESQDFIDGSYSDLIERSNEPGPVKDIDGNILGTHNGIWHYTIGQRKGLGIAAKHPLYVLKIEKTTNTIVVGKEDDLFKYELKAFNVNWIAIEKLERPMNVSVKIRYRHKEAEALISPVDSQRVLVKFIEQQKSVTPGQTVVFYDQDIVIGGGIIE